MNCEKTVELRESCERLARRLDNLVGKPRWSLGALVASDVLEKVGVYLFGTDDYDRLLYVGMATRTGPKASGLSSGLRFRIMENHLGKRGNDNFLKYLGEEIGGSKMDAVAYLKDRCYCQWLVVDDSREATLLKHFAIAVLNPLLNKA